MLAAPFALTACTTPPEPSPTMVTPEPVDLDLDTCLIGEWTADAGLPGDFMEHVVLDQLGGIPNGPTAVRADGTISLLFWDDGTFIYKPSLKFELDFPLAGTRTGDLTGSLTGTWQTIDDILISTIEDNSLSALLSIAGQEPTSGAYGWDSSPVAVSEMTCAGDRLDASFNLNDTSYPMRLTRVS
jgi:hypothetical protein